MENNSDPVIIGFFCNWCTYRAADAAGTARIRHAPNLRIIRVMCSGRVEPHFVLKAFKEGADGVIIAACHQGECHYETGNTNALMRFSLLRRLIGEFGIESGRLLFVGASVSEGKSLASLVDTMTADLKQLGPLKLRQSMDVSTKHLPL